MTDSCEMISMAVVVVGFDHRVGLLAWCWLLLQRLSRLEYCRESCCCRCAI